MIWAYMHVCVMDRSTVREIAIVYIYMYVRWSLFFSLLKSLCLYQAWSGGMAMDKSVDPTCICMHFFFTPSLIIYQSEKRGTKQYVYPTVYSALFCKTSIHLLDYVLIL